PDQAGSAVALIGVGGDELAPLEIDLTMDGPGFVIAGPPRSGRSSALITVARSLSARGGRLLVVAPRRSPVTDLADVPGVLGVLGRGATAADLADATATAAAEGQPLVVIADDAELLADAPLADALADFVKDARDTGNALVAAGTTEDLQSAYRGFTVDARRSRCGVLLCPASPLEGDLFTVRLPRSTVGATLPGRGLLAVRGQLTPIQVALS
ncbi:MAG: FtsK/SpoIIIE domain-containing protein, partial [Frankia sp.]